MMTGREKDTGSSDREHEDQDSEPTTMAPSGDRPTDVDSETDEDRGENV